MTRSSTLTNSKLRMQTSVCCKITNYKLTLGDVVLNWTTTTEKERNMEGTSPIEEEDKLQNECKCKWVGEREIEEKSSRLTHFSSNIRKYIKIHN